MGNWQETEAEANGRHKVVRAPSMGNIPRSFNTLGNFSYDKLCSGTSQEQNTNSTSTPPPSGEIYFRQLICSLPGVRKSTLQLFFKMLIPHYPP
ncbi:hypothetical protein J6590_066342 [Homalodisca vitripennis]|nr:hypothetical protein J6590_066342 [Homalodisca vitripennis]